MCPVAPVTKDVGLPDVDRRRVPGLRRSELAMLAGISTEYYVRLEQGRDRHPSAQVLDALARALQLDEHAAAHLHQLAAPASHRARRHRTEKVSAQVDALLRSLDQTICPRTSPAGS
jgi:transcriptional regulator with XRE-family HTH domain